MWCLLLLVGVTSAKIITLSREKNLTCVATEDSVSSTIYVSPPIKSGFIKPSREITNWITDDWDIVNAIHTNQNVVTDKRWEDFPMLDETNGHALENNSLSFSVCVTGNFSLDISSSDFVYEKWLHIAPSFLSFSENKNSCKWFHYSITKEGSTVNLISSENKQTFDVGFDPFWIYTNSSTGNATFWKLHNYDFRAATTATQEQESKVSVNFTDNLCLSMYVSIDKNSFLDVILETSDNITKTTIKGFNEKEDLKKWQKIEIEAPGFGEGNISFFRGLEQQGDQEGYWAIDEISPCNKEIEVLKASLEDEAPGDYVCKSLNQYDIPEIKNPENFKIRASSDGKAIVSCDHPIVINGPISNFVIEVQTKETGNNYTADIVEPQKTYTYKIPIEYNTEYTISISDFNKYEGEKSTITVTFTRFTSSFSSDGTIIETCGERCLIMVPKPEDLQYTSNYRIVGIPGNDTSTNIQRLLNSKVEPSEQEWLNLEDTGLYEEYFTADIGTPSAKTLSLHNIKDYSLYLVQTSNSNEYPIYPIQILEEEKSDSVAEILSLVFIVIINIFGILLIIILALLLSRLNRRNHWERNNFYQESFKVEQSTLITEIKTEKQFTKTQTRFLESILKNALLDGKTFIANLRSSSGATGPTHGACITKE